MSLHGATIVQIVLSQTKRPSRYLEVVDKARSHLEHKL
jgi:hypothetical protein